MRIRGKGANLSGWNEVLALSEQRSPVRAYCILPQCALQHQCHSKVGVRQKQGRVGRGRYRDRVRQRQGISIGQIEGPEDLGFLGTRFCAA